MSGRRYYGRVNEDGGFTIYGRVTARDATGSASPRATEGNLVLAADLSTITCRVYDITPATPVEITPAPTVTISSAIQATIQTTGIWGLLKDEVGATLGGNFLHDIPAANVPTGATDGTQKYLVEYKFTTTGGAVSWGQVEVVSNAILQS